MILRDLQDLISRDKRKTESLKTAKTLVVGITIAAALGLAAGMLFALKSGKDTREDMKKRAVNTVENIKGTVYKKAETVHDSAAHAVQEVSNVIENLHGKTEDVKKDIRDGRHEITQDIHKTAENISKEFNKPVK
jgi:gas vesicle protein